MLIRPKNGGQAKMNTEICHTEYEKNRLLLYFPLDPRIRRSGKNEAV
jgi:hypothetical protein